MWVIAVVVVAVGAGVGAYLFATRDDGGNPEAATPTVVVTTTRPPATTAAPPTTVSPTTAAPATSEAPATTGAPSTTTPAPAAETLSAPDRVAAALDLPLLAAADLPPDRVDLLPDSTIQNCEDGGDGETFCSTDTVLPGPPGPFRVEHGFRNEEGGTLDDMLESGILFELLVDGSPADAPAGVIAQEDPSRIAFVYIADLSGIHTLTGVWSEGGVIVYISEFRFDFGD